MGFEPTTFWLKTALTAAGSPDWDYTYTLDGNGNITKKVAAGPSGTTTASYGYDDANRLCWRIGSSQSSSACTPAPSGARTYTSDANGNETGDSGGRSFVYNAFDQTTSIWGAPYTYAGFNQFEMLTRDTSFINNTILGLTQVGTRYELRDPNGSPISERHDTSRRYFVPDGLGSTMAYTDSSGNVLSRYEYDPYGHEEAPAPSGTTTLLRYTGAYLPGGLNLYKMGMRWYDPTNQHWTQQDQIEGPGGQRTLNRYAYVGGDPVNLTDPTGLCWGPARRWCPDEDVRDVGGSAYDIGTDIVERGVRRAAKPVGRCAVGGAIGAVGGAKLGGLYGAGAGFAFGCAVGYTRRLPF